MTQTGILKPIDWKAVGRDILPVAAVVALGIALATTIHVFTGIVVPSTVVCELLAR